MERPRFKRVRETPWGPELERVRPDASEAVRMPMPEELPDAANDNRFDEAPAQVSRRGFLLGGAAAVAAAGVPTRLGDGSLGEQPDAANEELLTPESFETEATFENELTGYRAFVRLRKDEVQFVDAFNRPVGDPVVLEDFVGPLPEGVTVPEGQAPEYLYSLGERDELGLPVGNIPPRWLAEKRAQVQAEHPERPIEDHLHAVVSFRAMLAEDDEPELLEKLRSGEIDTYQELIEHFAQKPVVGAEEFTRQEYVQDAIVFDPEVPAVVQAELRRILPGLCGQESKFNNGLTSRAGAQGIFQFMPDTWASYGAEPHEVSSLRKQVEVAGRFFSDLYRQVLHHLGEEALQAYRQRYQDEESFLMDLIVPLMVNSYNAGAARVGEAARLFIARHPGAPEGGKDLFLRIAEFAEASQEGENEDDEGRFLNAYGRHAREYVPRVYATADVLNA